MHSAQFQLRHFTNKTTELTNKLYKMKAIRVLVVWGSETNNTQGFVNKIADEWKAKHGELKVLDVVQGDEIADRWDEVSADNYDFLLVATSSYGEGGPPSGFGKFLYRNFFLAKSEEFID